MKLQFVSYDNIDIIKSNLKSWVDNFKQDSSDWLQDELGNALFSDTKFAEIPDFNGVQFHSINSLLKTVLSRPHE